MDGARHFRGGGDGSLDREGKGGKLAYPGTRDEMGGPAFFGGGDLWRGGGVESLFISAK
jgi:hypothetical protein